MSSIRFSSLQKAQKHQQPSASAIGDALLSAYESCMQACTYSRMKCFKLACIPLQDPQACEAALLTFDFCQVHIIIWPRKAEARVHPAARRIDLFMSAQRL